MTPSPGIEPGPHWWEASALTLRQPCSPGVPWLIHFLLADWSREQVGKWVCSLFGDDVADRFFEEEIDGWTLLESKRLEEDKVLEKLGISTIGRKERFERELRALGPIMNGKICLPYLLSKFHNLSCSINFSYMIKNSTSRITGNLIQENSF